MKKVLLGVGVVALLASCGGPGKAEFDAAAEKLCNCMSEKDAEGGEDDLLNDPELNYSFCALEVAFDVAINDEQMAASIAEKCPDLSELHADYVKDL